MTRTKWVVNGSLAVIFAIAIGAPAHAARSIQGSAGEVTNTDGAALGPVGFRIWSALPGGETSFNDNVASCRNVRCIRTYITNTLLSPGGYVGNAEATQVYNGDLADQPFYELVDASMNDGDGNHIGYFGVSGVTANNSGIGSFLTADCGGISAQNCFGRIDSNDQTALLESTVAAYGGGPHQIRAIGGLNPIPVVGVTMPGSCDFGHVCLHWDNPPTYAGNMRPSTTAPAPPSPVKGVRLYRITNQPCFTPPAGNDPRWTSIGTFDLGENQFQDLQPPSFTCAFYALTVRLVGPGGDPNEVETFRVGANSAGVGGPFDAAPVVRFHAAYAGHGVVSLSWRTGLEGDLRGFFVTRATAPQGPFARVSDLIPAEGDGHEYAASDSVASAARSYTYRLELVGRDGRVTTGTAETVSVPGRDRKGGPRIR